MPSLSLDKSAYSPESMRRVMCRLLMYILILLLAGCGLIFPEDENTTTSNSAPTADTPTDNTTNNTPTCQIASNSFKVVGGEEQDRIGKALLMLLTAIPKLDQ